MGYPALVFFLLFCAARMVYRLRAAEMHFRGFLIQVFMLFFAYCVGDTNSADELTRSALRSRVQHLEADAEERENRLAQLRREVVLSEDTINERERERFFVVYFAIVLFLCVLYKKSIKA